LLHSLLLHVVRPFCLIELLLNPGDFGADFALRIRLLSATNAWNAARFPFLSQDLFYENGTQYDQTLILNADYSLNETALAEQGLPWYAASNALYVSSYSRFSLISAFSRASPALLPAIPRDRDRR
jgi:hypothetical protein